MMVFAPKFCRCTTFIGFGFQEDNRGTDDGDGERMLQNVAQRFCAMGKAWKSCNDLFTHTHIYIYNTYKYIYIYTYKYKPIQFFPLPAADMKFHRVSSKGHIWLLKFSGFPSSFPHKTNPLTPRGL